MCEPDESMLTGAAWAAGLRDVLGIVERRRALYRAKAAASCDEQVSRAHGNSLQGILA